MRRSCGMATKWMISQLVGGVAHDFNNMLGVILPALIIATPRATMSVVGACLIHWYATDRAEALTRKLLSFSRMGKVVFVTVSCNELLQMSRCSRSLINDPDQSSI